VIEAGYSLSEVSKLLGLSRSIVTGLIDAGFVSPARGRRKEYRFTFQDLVMLRAAADSPPRDFRRRGSCARCGA
jgi:hypothetical protein